MPIMVFGYMGEHNLYIPTRELVRLGAYQAQVIQIQYASPVGWAPEVEDDMVNRVIRMADRVRAGPIAIDEAVAIFVQIADGLEAAHERGVVHRDLKPDNIKTPPDGRVKILDFGIAKQVDGERVASGAAGNVGTSDPTVFGLTGDAVVLGTPAYMSPEQARGYSVDRRTDIWAFGCCLYEAVTGRPAFAAATTADTIARIVAEPDWNDVPDVVPPVIRVLLGRCLHKDARRRLRDIGDARIELEDLAGASEAGGYGDDPHTRRQGPDQAGRRRVGAAGHGSRDLRERATNRVPVIVGWNADEGSLAVRNAPEEVDAYRTWARRTYGDASDAFLRVYEATTPETSTAAFLKAYGDQNFGWEMRQWVWLTQTAGQPAYLYHFSRVPPGSPTGVYHAAEIRYVFDNLRVPGGRHAYTEVDARVSELMASYWVSFAATGDPNADGRGPPTPRTATS